MTGTYYGCKCLLIDHNHLTIEQTIFLFVYSFYFEFCIHVRIKYLYDVHTYHLYHCVQY